MEWHTAVDEVTPHVVQITSPAGSGTGFLLWRAKTDGLCAVATAAHVISHAHSWEQPIRLRLPSTGESTLLRPSDRAIIADGERDTAVIIFDSKELTFPPQPLGLIEEGMVMKVGASIGWLGFPALPSADLCFFTGSISARLESLSAYFVDGVAINGVSGGPAFAIDGDEPYMVGVVSAYMPNRATGEALPGLGIVRDVTQFHVEVQRFRSFDEAKAEESPPGESAQAAPVPTQSIPSANRKAV